jgi:hypothetical protein
MRWLHIQYECFARVERRSTLAKPDFACASHMQNRAIEFTLTLCDSTRLTAINLHHENCWENAENVATKYTNTVYLLRK